MAPALQQFGATLEPDGVRFSVRSASAERVWVCLFDSADRETDRLEMSRADDISFSLFVTGLKPGAHYGLRADGRYDPPAGDWFDPGKLLVDPYAVAIDRPYVHDASLAAPRGSGVDTARLVPKAIITEAAPPVPQRPPLFAPGGLIYEANVRGLTMRHPDIPAEMRGTIGALAHPAIVDHLNKLGVAAIELMPIVAWIDERHLPPLGLHNAWGYNPVTFKPLDPRLAPGGMAELRAAVATLQAAGIGVILDLVFNHTGESDVLGAILSLRGIEPSAYYATEVDGRLVNDTGTGNTIACWQPAAIDLILDALRHFVTQAGVDGFRFDLASTLGRTSTGFSAEAPLLQAMLADPLLADRVLIAEPWDIGPGGYQLGNFPAPFGEWNDRFRDDVRRFWRGDGSTIGALATRLAGSSDIFRRNGQTTTRSVNFISAHDGFALADLVAYGQKHNEANGEDNRDGHGENFSWNNGIEGPSDDPAIVEGRRRDLRALLSTLFASRGAIMLTAGDEFAHTQQGNNNAYCQDNEITWLDWANRDRELEDHVATLAAFRKRWRLHGDSRFLDGQPMPPVGLRDVEWLSESGAPLEVGEWEQPERHRLTMLLASPDRAERVAVVVNGDRRAGVFGLPRRDGFRWLPATATERDVARHLDDNNFLIGGRAVAYLVEESLA
jgi:glycogen operon protein